MKTKDIEEIIAYGRANNRTNEDTAKRIVEKINARWYHSRKDQCEDIIEVDE